MSHQKSPYEVVCEEIEAWAEKYYYDDFLVTLLLNDRITTEILVFYDGALEWLNDWWEGEKVKLLGFIPVSKIEVHGVPLWWEMHNSMSVEQEVKNP